MATDGGGLGEALLCSFAGTGARARPKHAHLSKFSKVLAVREAASAR